VLIAHAVRLLDATSSVTELSIYPAVLGTGIGRSDRILILVAQDGIPPTDIGAGTSTAASCTLGGAIGRAQPAQILAHRKRTPPDRDWGRAVVSTEPAAGGTFDERNVVAAGTCW
jgi:hypothetical protein